MPRMFRCSFCGKEFSSSVGSMFAKNDGTILHFCSGKCKKSELMGRDPRKLKWTVYHGKKERGR
ncbi:50S ribosomal protein L24e [Candidatus Bathyarchaeota archaeon]|nr:50S ribosomal protein L24e [Candidatus Bathyarchaeota archaeon]